MATKITDSGGSAPSGSSPNRRPRGSSWLSTLWFILQCLIALPLLPFLLISEAVCAPLTSRHHQHWLMWMLSKLAPALITGVLAGLAISYLKHIWGR